MEVDTRNPIWNPFEFETKRPTNNNNNINNTGQNNNSRTSRKRTRNNNNVQEEQEWKQQDIHSAVLDACQSNGEAAVDRLRRLFHQVTNNDPSGLSKVDMCNTLSNQFNINVQPIEVDSIPEQYLDPHSGEPLVDPYLVQRGTTIVNYNGSSLRSTDNAIPNQRLGVAVRAWLNRHGIIFNKQSSPVQQQQEVQVSQMVQNSRLYQGDLVWIQNNGSSIRHVSQLPTGRQPFVVMSLDPLQLVDSRQAPFRTITITNPNVSLLNTSQAIEECLSQQPQQYNQCLDTIEEYRNWLQIRQWQLIDGDRTIQELQDALLQSNEPRQNNNNNNVNSNFMSSYIS